MPIGLLCLKETSFYSRNKSSYLLSSKRIHQLQRVDPLFCSVTKRIFSFPGSMNYKISVNNILPVQEIEIEACSVFTKNLLRQGTYPHVYSVFNKIPLLQGVRHVARSVFKEILLLL
jgi:hypothetical protein